MRGTLRPVDLTRSARRVLAPALVALALTLVSCSNNSNDSAATRTTQRTSMTSPSSAPATVPADDNSPPPVNADVTDRARALLTKAGAERLVLVPGYEQEVNTGLEGVWRGEPLTAYVVPTSALPPADELRLLSRRKVKGRSVDVVLPQHSSVRMLRFERGPDTWLVTELDSMTKSDALVRALLS